MNVDYYDVASLAAVICGLPEDTDCDEAEQSLCDKFEISMESFHMIIEKLIELTPTWQSPLTGTVFHGFVKGNFAIVKAEATPEEMK